MTSKPKTVLIVDEDGAARLRTSALLQRHYRVLTAASGEAAITMLTQEDADLLVIDDQLPGISGLELLRIVRENYALPEIVMTSAAGRVETAVHAIKLGAYHFVTKAGDGEELLAVLRNASDHQDLNRQVLALSAQVADTDREDIIRMMVGRELKESIPKVPAKLGDVAGAREMAFADRDQRGRPVIEQRLVSPDGLGPGAGLGRAVAPGERARRRSSRLGDRCRG